MAWEGSREAAAIALDALRANKLRSALTILGVAIGVITVTFMVSIIQGLNRAFAEQIESLGSNTIFISKFDPSFGRPPTAEERQRKDLTVEDAEAIAREAKSVVSVAPVHRKLSVSARYLDHQTDTPALLGVTPAYEFTLSQYVGRGRFITEFDMSERSNVCVLAQDVVRALFPFDEPLDKEVRIDGRPFRVIGVMEPLGNFFGQSRDNTILIPLATFDKYYGGIDAPFPETLFFIIVRPRTRADVANAVDEITDILRRRRQVPAGAPNNFGISTQDSLLDFYNQLTGATALVLTAISFVALAIGGIGVMNIMLVSVTERTREIGIRKAVGARRRDILRQFLIEAVTLTLIGGLAGLIVGEVASLLMNRYSPLPAYVPLWAIIVGIGISALVGIGFGLWPAWKAARLDPVEALRYE
ncbi:ABC transporter permease [Pyrinomonas methylaliphatogenes]|jgi:putative ABC transport system permease protein|uniref:ABC-type antimicrobial peptide transport system, permease component n=1 Tax=Pyrinomonas methylaliphatogenes TaxID=454194 RepID=A0A0B6X0M7_9BACT|nr:ABC transporter permease [Pyrinomonas methylaliphatogenes]MBX5479423.1 ABC transporter permease [Pyrinomonas methylaliphatogenes]CDM66906.1 ABC-type antimicrobial peptide transport system, permease component [Pyrinomonas methylaliphatogenes]